MNSLHWYRKFLFWFWKKKFDKEHLIYNKMFSAQKIEVEIKTSKWRSECPFDQNLSTFMKRAVSTRLASSYKMISLSQILFRIPHWNKCLIFESQPLFLLKTHFLFYCRGIYMLKATTPKGILSTLSLYRTQKNITINQYLKDYFTRNCSIRSFL